MRTYNPSMCVREAKDFLVGQIMKQAELDDLALEDLEIQMLYFTEQGGASARMQEVANNFDNNYDVSVYEKKITHLMKRA